MNKILAIVYTEETKEVLTNISAEIDVEIEQKDELTNFIYSLKEKDYQCLIIENDKDAIDILKIVRIAKDLRPEIPQIIISDDKDKQIISLLHQEGIFYKCVPPIEKELTINIIKSAFDFFNKHHKMNY